jgi:hypothetical protein
MSEFLRLVYPDMLQKVCSPFSSFFRAPLGPQGQADGTTQNKAARTPGERNRASTATTR